MFVNDKHSSLIRRRANDGERKFLRLTAVDHIDLSFHLQEKSF